MSSRELQSTLVVEPIGRVESPIADPAAAARQPDEGAPGATLVLRPELGPALDGLRVGDDILVLTWLHLARREELTTHPRNDRARPRQGVFSTRSPERPNPIGVHRTTIAAIDGTRIDVDRFEAIDGTPVLDIKPVLVERDERDSVASTP
jgi:tRNA-Thr(GGU) m(6)t(6)A37 methyltransferase TsaA